MDPAMLSPYALLRLFVTGTFATLHYCDMDFDFANAGQAWHMASAPLEKFQTNWQTVPLIGPIVAYIGLPSTLTSLAVAATLYQIRSFRRSILSAKSGIQQWAENFGGRKARLSVWFPLQHACDASGIVFVADAVNMLIHRSMMDRTATRLGKGQDVKTKYSYAGRSEAFKCKVLCEASPALWFTVSMLQCGAGTLSSYGLVLLGLSMATSVATIAKESARELMGCVESVRVGFIWKGFETYRQGAVYRVTLLMLSTCLFMASFARLGGIFYCDSHVLNLSQGCLVRQGPRSG